MISKHLEQSWDIAKCNICRCIKDCIFFMTQSIHMYEIYMYMTSRNTFIICNGHSSPSSFLFFHLIKEFFTELILQFTNESWPAIWKTLLDGLLPPVLLTLIVWVPWHPKHLAPHQQPCLILYAPTVQEKLCSLHLCKHQIH